MRFLSLLPILALLAACATQEPTQTPTRAEIPQSLAIDAPVTGQIETTGGQDVWRLRLDTPRTLRLQALPAEGETPIDGLSVRIFTPEGREVSRREGQPGVTMILGDLAPGVYRVVVQGFKLSAGDYRLSVRGLTEIRSTPTQG